MLLVAVGWVYVVLMVALVEATSPQGTLLGAAFTLLLYGVLPLGIVGYLFFSPARRRARRAVEGRSTVAPGLDPDRRGHPAGDTVAPEREEP
jgi:predicted membrane channel-forming protein YqfA (hemolysin III family)